MKQRIVIFVGNQIKTLTFLNQKDFLLPNVATGMSKTTYSETHVVSRKEALLLLLPKVLHQGRQPYSSHEGEPW